MKFDQQISLFVKFHYNICFLVVKETNKVNYVLNYFDV